MQKTLIVALLGLMLGGCVQTQAQIERSIAQREALEAVDAVIAGMKEIQNAESQIKESDTSNKWGVSEEKLAEAARAARLAALDPPIKAERPSELVAKDLSGQVISISDGKTFTLLDNNNVKHKIRINAIDVPELNQPYGKTAKNKLSELCYKRTAEVTVTYMDTDRHGRTVGDVTCDEHSGDVASTLVIEGMAWVYDIFVNDEHLFLRDYQKSAYDKHLGLWADKNPTPPWEWRKKHASKR